jgi:hypothetical protein
MKGMVRRMKRLTKNFFFNLSFFMLAGCAEYTNEDSATDVSETSSVVESIQDDTTKTAENSSKLAETDIADANDISSEESVNNGSDSTSSVNSDYNEDDKEVKKTLSQYSSEQIEYARVWLQLGANQDIDGLYVQHIPAGTPLNPNDDTSASYPEDVIQLAGSRLVDGSVTYSGNGDGTINVYNVPLRWDGTYPAGEKFYTDIIKNTKLVSVEPGDDEKIIKLIKLLKIDQ